MEKEKEIKLFSPQWSAFCDEHRYVAAIAGKQAGKSFLGSVWLQKKITENPKQNGLIAAPTHKILQQSTLDKFFGLFPAYRQFYKQQQSVLELPTGGKIYIRSTDTPLGLEGMTIAYAWLDEAGMMSRLVWQIIRARTAVMGGQVMITTSPYNLGWLYREFYLPWKNSEDKDLSVHSWKSVDSPYFPQDFYEKEKQRLSPQEFARMYEGMFTKMSGLVYELKDNQIIEPREVNNCEAVIAGLDWGYNNPAAIAVLKVKDGVFYLVDEWYQTEKTTDEILQAAKIFQEKYHINGWYPDPAEPDRLEEMRRRGFYVRETNKDVKFGISLVQQLVRENRFYVFRSCQNSLDEFDYYHYDEEKIKEEPVKENDHLMDAIRYAIVGYQPVKNPARLIVERTTARRAYQSLNSFE